MGFLGFRGHPPAEVFLGSDRTIGVWGGGGGCPFWFDRFIRDRQPKRWNKGTAGHPRFPPEAAGSPD